MAIWDPKKWNIPGAVQQVTDAITPAPLRPLADTGLIPITQNANTQPLVQPTNAAGDPLGTQFNVKSGLIHTNTPTTGPNATPATGGSSAGLPGLSSLFGVTDFNPTNPAIDKVDFATALRNQMNATPAVNQVLGGPNGLFAQYNNEIAGKGAGTALAQALMKQASDRNAKIAAGTIASTRGINPAVAAKLAADTEAQANQGSAADTTKFALQEQLAARQALGDLGIKATELQNNRLQTLGSGMNSQNQNVINATTTPDKIRADIATANSRAKALVAAGVMGGAGGSLASLATALKNGGSSDTIDGSSTGVPAGDVVSGTPTQVGNATPGNASPGGYTGPDVSSASSVPQVASTSLGGTNGKGFTFLADGGEVEDDSAKKDDELEEDMNFIRSSRGGNSAKAGAPSEDQSLAWAQLAIPILTAAMNAAHGGKVPGKARVSGDSPKNDTVDAKLSPGEIVIPRTSANDREKAHRFVDAIMDKKARKKGYAGVLAAKRKASA